MKTIFELMTTLTAISSIAEGAEAAIKSGLAGSKDIYLAWGKERGESLKSLNEEWKKMEEAIRPAKRAGATGFAAEYYDWLAGDSRSEAEARDYIMSNESQNVRNHLTHYLNIWALCESVRSGSKVIRSFKGEATEPSESAPKTPKATKVEPEWEYDSAHPFADEKSAAETLKRQMNLVAKKRTIKVLEEGSALEWDIKESFAKLLDNTRAQRKGQ